MEALRNHLEPCLRPARNSTSDRHRGLDADSNAMECDEWPEPSTEYSSIDQDSVPALKYLRYGGIKTDQGFTFLTEKEMFQCTKENLVCLPPLSNYQSDSHIEDGAQTQISGVGKSNKAAINASIMGSNVAIEAGTSNKNVQQNLHSWHQDENHERIPRAAIRVKVTSEDFSQQFRERLAAVRSAPDKRAAWKELVKDFGTHYVKEVVLGGSITKQAKNRNDNNEETQNKDGNIAAGFLPGQVAGGPATRIGVGHQSTSNATTERKKNYIEMRGLTGGEGDASEWTRRQERRQYWSFIEYKQTAPISTLLSRADRRDLGLSTLSGKKLVYSEDCIRRNGVLCRSNKGWFKTSREDMLEIHKPVISTHSLCWLGDTANRSGFCGLYDLDGLLSPIFTFTVEWESDDKKEYILKPVAEDNANYDTIGFCYYHSEEELSYEKMSKLIDQKPWNRLRGVRRDLLERVEWRPDPTIRSIPLDEEPSLLFLRTAPSKFKKLDLYQVGGRVGKDCEAEPNGLLLVSKHRSRRARAALPDPQLIFRIKKGLLHLEEENEAFERLDSMIL